MGIIWLIRDGKEWVNQSRDIEGVDQSWINAKAPRIAIGYNKFGHLVIYHNNGYHTGEPGADLYEVVQILRKFDIVNAVNLDGGGSTSVVLKNVVINRCSDKCQPNDLPNRCPSTEDRCERLVTTICCIANRK
jgi:N-acetylglucosamine-1-phosphodiester alpha-N-acetylglucosaminidase